MPPLTNGNTSKISLNEQIVAAIKDSLSILVPSGCVFEVRIIDFERKGRTDAGYFDDIDEAANAIAKYDTKPGCTTIYMTLNPVLPGLLARAANRIKPWAANTTTDLQITQRTRLLIDCDPQRPEGISSTDVEHQATHERTDAIRAWLTEQGWPEPLVCNSGNGHHLMYAIDLANDDTSAKLVQDILNALGDLFDDDIVKVGRKVFNAGRVCKVYGTMVRKGDNVSNRPHRRSAIVSKPETLEPVPIELLQALASRVSQPEQPCTKQQSKTSRADASRNGTAFVEDFLSRHTIATNKEKQQNYGIVYRLITCPFCGVSDNSAVIVVRNTGEIGYTFHHNRCQGKTWQDLRQHYEPGCYDRFEPPIEKDGWYFHPEISKPLVCGPKALCLFNDSNELVYSYKPDGYDQSVFKKRYTAWKDATTSSSSSPPQAHKQAQRDQSSTEEGVTLRRKTPMPRRGSEVDLNNLRVPEVVVPTFFKVGFCLFIGQAGAGKTPCLRQLALAFATGGYWLGSVQVPKIPVIYIGMEYTEDEIWNDIARSSDRTSMPDNLRVFGVDTYENPPQTPDEVFEDFTIYARMGIRVIIIDMLVGFLPDERFKQTQYRGDYKEFLPYHTWAMNHNVLIIGAWHGTKRDTNPKTMYNGGAGMWGAAGGGRVVMCEVEDKKRIYSQLRGCNYQEWEIAERYIGNQHFFAIVDDNPGPVLDGEDQTDGLAHDKRVCYPRRTHNTKRGAYHYPKDKSRK